MSEQRQSFVFLTALNLPAISLAAALGVNNPTIYHWVLTHLSDRGVLESFRINTFLSILGIVGLIVSAIAQPVIGALSDRTQSRFGRRFPFMFVGSLLLIGGLFWEIRAQKFWTLLVASIVVNIALSSIQNPLHALIPDYVSQSQKGIASGVKTLLELVGVIIAGALVWLFLGQANRPNAAILLVWIFVFITIIVAYTAMPSEQVNRRRVATHIRYARRFAHTNTLLIYLLLGRKTLRHIVRRRKFIWWLIHRIFLFGAFGIITKFTITYLVDVFGFTNEDARALQGQLIVILGTLILLTPLISGWLSDRIGQTRLISVAGFVAGVSMFIISQTRSLELAIVMMTFVGIATAVFFTISWAVVTSIVPFHQTAFYMGLTNIATSLGSALGFSGGFVVDVVNANSNSSTTGYMSILLIAGLFYMLSALAIHQTIHRHEIPSVLPDTATAI